MNIYYKAIQKSFDLLDEEETKKDSFMTALKYILKIAEESKYETEKCFIHSDKHGDIIILMTSIDEAKLTINANQNGISYAGEGPREEDHIQVTNTESYSVNTEVFEWIKRNRK